MICRTSLSGVFHGVLVAQLLLGGQAARSTGGSLTRSNSAVQSASQGQSLGRCSVIRRAEDAIRAGMIFGYAAAIDGVPYRGTA